MKRNILIFITLITPILFPLSTPVMCATPEATSSHYADSLYAANAYAEAAIAYETLLTLSPSAELYYNLGNAYFKQGELALAILSYERCLRLEPNMKDAKYNLAFAQSRITDNITDTQTFFISSWLRTVRNQLRESTWRWISIILFWSVLICLIFFTLSKEQWIRKTAFYTGVIALLISVVSITNSISLYRRDTIRAEAIVIQGIVNAKASPDRSGTELFTIHEGTKVIIHETLSDWCKIQVGNNVGWILLSNVERI